MDNERINQLIHEKVMGECWHKFDLLALNKYQCECGLKIDLLLLANFSHLDYCSDLNAVAKAEAKVIENHLKFGYGEALCEVVDVEDLNYNPNINYKDATRIATATARQRAEAVLRASGLWEESV